MFDAVIGTAKLHIWKRDCRYCNACENNSFVLRENERTFACAKVGAKKILSSKARFLFESAETTFERR